MLQQCNLILIPTIFLTHLSFANNHHRQTQFCHHTHKRTESFDFAKNMTVNASIDSQHHRTLSSTSIKSGNIVPSQQQPPCSPGMSPVLRKNIIIATQQQFRSESRFNKKKFSCRPQSMSWFFYIISPAPSPRQRCRIRTNPWVPTVDPEPLIMPTTPTNSNLNNKKRDRDSTGSTTTSSSGIKSNSDESNEMQTQKSNKKSSNGHITDSDSSSSTEKPNKTLVSLNEFRKKFNSNSKKENSNQLPISISTTQHGESDEDATLNEIGKFDESYVYEKENDIIRWVHACVVARHDLLIFWMNLFNFKLLNHNFWWFIGWNLNKNGNLLLKLQN